MDRAFADHGFLPNQDPLKEFPRSSPLAVLDDLGHDLPSLLQDPGFRERARRLVMPQWTEPENPRVRLPQMRLCYVRLGFLAAAYINQVGEPPVDTLPRNLAVPLCDICRRLSRPPILSYDGYALFNWKRFDPAGPIALGNIDTIQNFVHLYDEHWFILVHVEIEQIAAGVLAGVDKAGRGLAAGDPTLVNEGLRRLARASASRSPSCGGSLKKWTPRSTSKPFGRISGFSSTWSSKESTNGRWTSAAKRGRKAASCRRSSPS